MMLTAQDVATLLRVSLPWVYRHKHALGGFQLSPGAAVRFSENRIEQIRTGAYALPDAKREMTRDADDTGPRSHEVISDQGRGKKMGGRTKRRDVGSRDFTDPYGLLA